jgi:hypothetical protein
MIDLPPQNFTASHIHVNLRRIAASPPYRGFTAFPFPLLLEGGASV